METRFKNLLSFGFEQRAKTSPHVNMFTSAEFGLTLQHTCEHTCLRESHFWPIRTSFILQDQALPSAMLVYHQSTQSSSVATYCCHY